jgi:signal transduction histidine kinase
VEAAERKRHERRGLLAKAGFSVLEASTCEKALELAARSPDAILLGTAGRKAFDLCRQLRSDSATSSIPVVHLSDRGRGLLEVTASDAYLSPPVQPRILVATLRAVVRERRAKEETARAIAERDRLLAQLATERKLLEVVLRQVPVGVMVTFAEEGGPILLNEEAEKMWSSPRTDPAGAEARLGRDALYRSLLSGEGLAAEEVRFARPDGTVGVAEQRAAPVRDASGKIAAAVATVFDVTERNQGRGERAKLVRELEEALRAREEFLSIASHDLKAPLSVLQLGVQTILYLARRHNGAGLSPEKLVPRLDALNQRIDELLQFLAQVLDTSRISAGSIHLYPEPIDLAALVQEIIGKWRDQLAQAGCEVELEAPQRSVRGTWDRVRLEQIVNNLLSNAAKYGAGKPIKIAIGGDERTASLSIRDHGIGIAPEDQERIFQRFERVTSRKKSGSFGLGLWIVQRIIDAMGGSIRVKSELGEGARFTVELPRVRRGSS